MAVDQSSNWDDAGIEPPAGEAKYVVGEQPIAEYDNHFNYSVAKDIENMIAEVVDKFSANTILKADTDNNPVALAVAASRILGRKSTGGIAALTAAEVSALGIAPAAHTIDKHTNVSRNLFIPATECYTTGAISMSFLWAVVKLDPDSDEQIMVVFRIPNDYASGGAIKFLYLEGEGSPNTVVWDLSLYHAINGEAAESNSVSDYGNSLAIAANKVINEVTTSLSLTNPTKGDYVALYFNRDANNVSDNYTLDFMVVGFIFEYTAEQ